MSTEKISTESQKILATGSVFTYKQEPINLEVESGNEQIHLCIYFVEEEGKDSRIDWAPSDDGKKLEMKIFNAGGFDRIKSIEPIEIYIKDNKKVVKLGLAFQSMSAGFLCHYTIFEEK